MSTAEMPRTERWWPSRYGAGDEIGSLNEVTPEASLRGASIVRFGALYDLSHVLDEHIPAFPGTCRSVTACTTGTGSTTWSRSTAPTGSASRRCRRSSRAG